jgi:hypothetical protein
LAQSIPARRALAGDQADLENIAPACGQGFFHGMDAVQNLCFQSDPIFRLTPAVVRHLTAEPLLTGC